ncbi:MAG: crotonase/enoyl-CoA hydratase family protein [Gammaproteobacteria bacterium]
MNTHNLTSEIQLRNFTQIEMEVDAEYGVIWIYLNPTLRPCFNETLINEVRSIQLMLEAHDGTLPYNGERVPVHYFVVDSHTPGIFSMGGDLRLFREFVIREDKEGFLKHARLCIDTLYGLITGCGLPITTISLVRGDAIGGGFETALSCQVVIAEQGIEMGLPEILFNLFPGMGAYHLLSQRIPPKQAEKLMLSGRKYPAQELYDMGLIDKLVEEGQGRNAVYSYIKESNRYRNGYLALKHIRERVNPISYDEMMEVCSYWVEVAMKVTDRDLKLMDDLVKAQEYRLAATEHDRYEKSIA